MYLLYYVLIVRSKLWRLSVLFKHGQLNYIASQNSNVFA